MSDPQRRQAAATAATGAGLVAAGGQLRHAGVTRAVRSSGQSHPPIHPLVFVRNAPGRRLYATGVGAGLSGATAMGVGLHELARRKNVRKVDGHRLDPVDFVSQGMSGTADAVRARAESSRDRTTSPRAKAAVAGAGLASGAVGSHLTARAIRSLGHGRRISPALTALGGTAAGVASLPLTNRVASRRGYEVTPTGVRRKKTPSVRPTRSATVVETRANRGAPPNARQQLVPSDNRFAKYYGDDLSPNQKRARVMAAGAAPIVGPAAAAVQAGRMAPPDQRKSAAALQYGGYATGGLTGAVIGSQAASRAAERSPGIARNLDRANAKINSAKDRLRIPRSSGPGRVGRAAHRMAERPGAAGRFARPMARRPGAAAVGGLAGKAVGAAAGAFIGYSTALRREAERNAKMNSVDKAMATQTGMSRREQRAQIQRKKRNLGLSMVSTGVGAAGVGLLGARELGPRLPRVGATIARHGPRLERAGLGTALVGGGVGAVQGSQSARIQRRDLHAQERVYGLSKAGPRLVRTAGLRSSYLRRTPKGTVRVANSVTKMKSKFLPSGPHPLPMPTGRRKMPVVDRVAAAGRQHEIESGRKIVRPYNPEAEARAAAKSRQLRANKLAAMTPQERMRDRMRNSTGGFAGIAGIPSRLRRSPQISKLDTTMDEHHAKEVVGQYGLKSPLPRHLPRQERMRAYEARYVAAGGPKGEKWQRRSDNLDHVTGGALATGGAAALTELASHKGRIHPGIAPKANRVGLTAAGVGALSELAHRHAQHKASSYKSSPAGVAASALRRMRNYGTED